MKKIFLIFILLFNVITLAGCGDTKNSVMIEFTTKIEDILKNHNIQTYKMNQINNDYQEYTFVNLEISSSEFDNISHENMHAIIKEIDVEKQHIGFSDVNMSMTVNFKSDNNSFSILNTGYLNDSKILKINDKIVYYYIDTNEKYTINDFQGVWNTYYKGQVTDSILGNLVTSYENHTYGFYTTYPTLVYIDPYDNDHNGTWDINNQQLIMNVQGRKMIVDVLFAYDEDKNKLMYWFSKDGTYIELKQG